MRGILLLSACLLVVAWVHVPVDAVTCRECGGRGHDHFPACLSDTVTCHHEEVCQVRYGGEHTEIRCHFQEPHDDHCPSGGSSVTSSHCPLGGAWDGVTCKLCCTNDQCVSQTADQLVAHLASISGLHCPARECPSGTSLQECLASGSVCTDNHFCKVSKGGRHHEIHGICEHHDDLTHCREELSGHHHGADVLACCTDQSCVNNLFVGTSTTEKTTTTTTTTTTTEAPSTTTTTTLPPTTAAPVATTTADSGSGALTCSDFGSLDCITLLALCTKVNCPLECNRCLHPPTTPMPTTEEPIAVTDMPTTTTEAPTTTTATSRPTSTTTTMRPTTTTTMPPPTTTTMLMTTTTTTTTTTTAPPCADTMPNDVDCADLSDVCSSSLLAPYCSKFCGMCD